MHWPPEGEQRIRELLSNLEEYIYEDETGHDLLVKMAVMHYQFEAIHPFDDGNGRTGRILNILYLLDETLKLAREKLPGRVYSKELIELLFEQPYCKVKFLVDRDIAKRQTAAEYLRELEEAGILKSKRVGRENLFVNVGLYDLLTGNSD